MKLGILIFLGLQVTLLGVYQEPNLQVKIFDPQKISLNEKEKEQVASTLASLVTSRSDPLSKEALLCSKALALALRLAPNHKTAVVANFQLARGLKPALPKEIPTETQLSATLYTFSQQLRAKEKEQDLRLANYLLDLVVEIDPRNEAAIVEREKAKKQNFWIDWSEVVDETAVTSLLEGPHPVQKEEQKEASPFLRSQNMIKGLVVQQQPDGQFQGSTLEIIATVEKGNAAYTSYATFNLAVGKQMTISLDEAMRAVKVDYPIWDAGRVIKISFDDKYTDKDGGSAGTALTLLLLSLFEDVKLDPLFALTGDITVDHKVRKVGKIAEKIRGATLGGCQWVAIPKANQDDIDDMALLYPLKTLSGIQIFSIETLSEAMALARVDKTEKINEALELFQTIQKVATGSNEAYLKTPHVQEILKQILELTPNHLSARYLLKRSQGKTSTTLSLPASLEQILVALHPFWTTLYYDAASQVSYGSRQTLYSIPGETVEHSLAVLSQLQLKLHPKTIELQRNAMDYLKLWKRLRDGGTVSEGFLLQLSQKAKTVTGSLEKLKTDRETLESYSRK